MIKELILLSRENTIKSYRSTKEWAADYYHLTKEKTPFEKALLGGFSCQQFSFAFMAGYQAALEKMFPTIAPNELKALCVSEEKGGHPKVIQTTLVNNQIKGLKTYVTAGSDASHFLVLWKTNETLEERPLLKIVHLINPSDNMKVSNFELPFMKEVKHGKLALENTPVSNSQILEGDGFEDYAKPFRTLEDILVGTAQQAMLLRQAIDSNWNEALREQLLLNLHTFKYLLQLPALDKETHLLLTANEQRFEELLPKIDAQILEHSATSFQENWNTNKKVLNLAKKVKEIRLAKARVSLFG